MRRIVATWIIAMLAGCGSSGPVATPDSRSRDDGRSAVVEGGTQRSLLQVVVNKIILPTRVDEYALDLDGNGVKDNQLGAIQAAVAALNLGYYDFQSNLDRVLGEGAFLLMIDLLGRSLVEDPAVRLEAAEGVDLDSPPNPADNFSGSEPLAIASTSPTGLVLDGAIRGGRLAAGPGALVAPLPSATGTAPQTVTLKRAQLSAEIGPGLSKGLLNGGIAWTEVDQKFIPMIASEVTSVLKDPATTENVKTALTIAFDADKSGTVSADEIRQSQLLKLVLKPDVDLDGDKTSDALSVGMAFTAVPCVIKR